MPPQSVLQFLPNDILELIVKEAQSVLPHKAFCGLRLVCKAFEYLVAPLVLESVKIQSNRADMRFMRKKLSYMASPASPWARWTRRLDIGALCVPPSAIQLEWSDDDDSEGDIDQEERQKQIDAILVPVAEAWKVQSECLLPALEALIRVEEASTKALVNNSPNLRSLEIIVRVDSGYRPAVPIDLSDLVEGSLHNPTFAPTLRELYLTHDGVRLTGSCIPYLTSLAALRIGISHNDTAYTSPSFWVALEESCIQLESLEVYELTVECARYASSYVGLKVLRVQEWKPGSPHLEERAHLLMDSVIPKQSPTLQELSIFSEHSSGSDKSGPWCITEENLAQILQCRRLQTLKFGLTYDHDASEPFHISLDRLLASMTEELPLLSNLSITPLWKHWPHIERGHESFEYEWGRRDRHEKKYTKRFISLLEGTTFRSNRRPHFSLKSAWKEFEPVRDSLPDNWRYKVVIPPGEDEDEEESVGWEFEDSDDVEDWDSDDDLDGPFFAM